MSYEFDETEAQAFEWVDIYEVDDQGRTRKIASVRQPRPIYLPGDNDLDTDAMAAELNRRVQIVVDALNAAEFTVVSK